MKFRKKPVVIEAFKYNGEDNTMRLPIWFIRAMSSQGAIKEVFTTHCEIKTLEGIMRGENGDYIIQGVNGEIYPCKPDIFEKTYDRVPDNEVTDYSENNYFDFIIAVLDEMIPKQSKVSRAGWTKGDYMQIKNNCYHRFYVNAREYGLIPSVPSDIDIQAEDWFVVD